MDKKGNKNSIFPFFHMENWKVIALLMIAYDIVFVNASYFLALLLRFDFRYSLIPLRYLNPFYSFAPIYTIFCIIIFMMFKLYRSIWAYASYDELVRVIYASIITTIFHILGITVFFQRMPLSYYMMGPVLQFFFTAAIRFSYRFVLLLRNHSGYAGNDAMTAGNIMVIGAGNAGQALIRDINRAQEINGKVVAIIDDDSNKWGRYIDGCRVIGGKDMVIQTAREMNVSKIYLAIPSATAAQRRDILEICQQTTCELMNLPATFQFLTGEITVSKMKKVSVEDLLGREPIRTDMEEVFGFINGKRVLVTGGGGSIGSELCRQIAAHSPELLIIFDIYENNAYDIQNELRERYPNLNLKTIIGSVRDSRRMYELFGKYHPQIVYHAAAHKHVPLMEESPNEAIKNNTIGTYKTAYAAMVHGCERFVLISTDKAVNPTNIMGASKRICEMIIQTFDAKIKEGKANEIPQLFTHEGNENADKDGTGQIFKNIKTEYVAVRFGNVLGSNGSVVPLFRKQIENGGPVTVTHPDIIRYFMTIPEAVSLVMVAGTYAKGGEIFVLDMGSPVKIDSLARNLIRLSGYKPDIDIKIEYTGLRPGEKLFEEKLMAEEGLQRTENELIHIGVPIPFDINLFFERLMHLMNEAYKNSCDIREQVHAIVDTYRPKN